MVNILVGEQTAPTTSHPGADHVLRERPQGDCAENPQLRAIGISTGVASRQGLRKTNFLRGMTAMGLGALCLLAGFPTGAAGCLMSLLVGVYFLAREGAA